LCHSFGLGSACPQSQQFSSLDTFVDHIFLSMSGFWSCTCSWQD